MDNGSVQDQRWKILYATKGHIRSQLDDLEHYPPVLDQKLIALLVEARIKRDAEQPS